MLGWEGSKTTQGPMEHFLTHFLDFFLVEGLRGRDCNVEFGREQDHTGTNGTFFRLFFVEGLRGRDGNVGLGGGQDHTGTNGPSPCCWTLPIHSDRFECRQQKDVDPRR